VFALMGQSSFEKGSERDIVQIDLFCNFKNMKKLFLIIPIFLLCLSGCSNNKEIEQLKEQNILLKEQVKNQEQIQVKNQEQIQVKNQEQIQEKKKSNIFEKNKEC
jgi:uncharacterized protein YcfL